MLTFTHNVEEVMAALTEVERQQVPQATAWALNAMADEVLKGVQSDMDTHFDRPTRFTKNAFMVWRAKKRAPFAEVKERQGVGPRHYLKVQERGGARPRTGIEGLFIARLKYEGDIQAIVPAAAAKRDAFGNWSTGERNQVLSAVQVQRDETANTTKDSRSRAKRRAAYFVPRPGSKLSAGVWKRANAKAKPVKVVHFTDKKPRYAPRLGFLDGAEKRVRKSFAEHFADAFRRAMETASRD